MRQPICGPKCWAPVKCPDHRNEMKPIGRWANPEWHFICCENYMRTELNTRHLWDEHDDARHYVDPSGWAEHYARCAECNRSLEEET